MWRLALAVRVERAPADVFAARVGATFDHRNNMRAMLQSVEAGEMLE